MPDAPTTGDVRSADDVTAETRHMCALIEAMTTLFNLLDDRYVTPAEVAAAFAGEGLQCVERYDSRRYGDVLGHLKWFDEGDELVVRLPVEAAQGRAQFLGEWLTSAADALGHMLGAGQTKREDETSS